MTSFNSQVGGGIYKIQFETNNQKAYRIVKNIIRAFVDFENAQEVVVSKKENTTLVEECSVCGCPENTEVQANIRKAEDCRYYTQNSFWGAGCLGTMEIDPCKGDGCERWKSKEDT